jgi:hypothetical protein
VAGAAAESELLALSGAAALAFDVVVVVDRGTCGDVAADDEPTTTRHDAYDDDKRKKINRPG